MIEDNPAFRAVASNITPDRRTGIGAWTDAQIARAIREGIRPDGSVIGPPMPIAWYRDLADEDVAAMVAYLRSIPAVANVSEKSTYRMPLPPNYGPPVGRVVAPPRSDMVRYGAYLAGPVGHCMECHTPSAPRGSATWSGWGSAVSPSRAPGASRSPPTSPPVGPPASAVGAMRRSSGRSAAAFRRTGGSCSRRCPSAITPASPPRIWRR
ncbi:hypothetical protein ACFQU2_15845 [Siccirubricoccus deserti]